MFNSAKKLLTDVSTPNGAFINIATKKNANNNLLKKQNKDEIAKNVVEKKNT